MAHLSGPIPSPTPGPIHFDPRLVLWLVLHRALRAQLSIEPGLHQQGDHGHGAHGQLPALPEQGVDQRGDAGGVHAVDVRQPGWVLGSGSRFQVVKGGVSWATFW